MNTKVEVQRRRHIIKAISWRLVGTLDTWIISWLLLTYIGEITLLDINIDPKIKKQASEAASLIAVLELISKTILYYFHERIWYKITWINIRQKYRHIIKTFSWRLIGAIDTILLVFIVFYLMFSSIQGAAAIAVSMFSIEIITKMILYYFHERLWFISNYGVIKN
tara:strand:+ start:7703 stop:8200 length:498 start_codon:yes stop_codon:yes gene_type:complete